MSIRLPYAPQVITPEHHRISLAGADGHLECQFRCTASCISTHAGAVLSIYAAGDKASLLSEDDFAIWHSRGQISFESLLGDCGKYPEYGTLRHFDLREFRLTLLIKNIEFDTNNKLTGFDLAVTLKRKPGANSPRAQRTGFLYPKEGCQKVRKGYEPLMCRDPARDGSWGECKSQWYLWGQLIREDEDTSDRFYSGEMIC
jgi:hypothetical protein